MHKAYDTILQSEVSAELSAQSGGFEPYRYECACCGEEVFIAAPYSSSVKSHFRHRSGNNDVECEKYLGRYKKISTNSNSKKSKRERLEFYYDNGSRSFTLDIRFSEQEIKEYEQGNVELELRTKKSESPFYVVPINRMNFTPDAPTSIDLSCFSSSYYISNTLNDIKREYSFMKDGNAPAFFKLQGNDNDFKAKLVRSNILYTDIPYIAVFQRQFSTLQTCPFPERIQIREDFLFETMNKKYLGVVLTISDKSIAVDNWLQSWGYQLEKSETLTLLWPPAPVIDDVSVITSNQAYVFTSFELQGLGNINVHSKDIIKIHHNVSKICVQSNIKIYRKNAEIALKKEEQSAIDHGTINLLEIAKDIFTVPDEGLYYLFNQSGVQPLSNGQTVFLTPNSSIVQFKNNYPVCYIYPAAITKLTGDELLEDILKHYKNVEPIAPNQFDSLILSEIASRYIDSCKAFGSINSVAKQYIEEGNL